MNYDFETVTDKRFTGLHKWQPLENLGDDYRLEYVPLTVADMEFPTAPEIVEGLKTFIETRSLGYSQPWASYYEAVVAWLETRHQTIIQPEWIVLSPGVVSAIEVMVQAFSDPGHGVIINNPLYPPFARSINALQRKVVNCPLIKENQTYKMDFEAIEEACADPNNKIFMLCSPHNPTGRIWDKDELQQLATILKKHQVYLFSDEIWMDFELTKKHTTMLKADPEIMDLIVLATAPSKSFNLASMWTSNIIIPNPVLRDKFCEVVTRVKGNHINSLGVKACELAYRHGEIWFDELLEVVILNQKMVHEFFLHKYPQIYAPLSEGTYIMWVDFNALNMSEVELDKLLREKAFIYASTGTMFGPEGKGFIRLNVAVPTWILEKTLKRLDDVLKEVI